VCAVEVTVDALFASLQQQQQQQQWITFNVAGRRMRIVMMFPTIQRFEPNT